MKYVINRYPIMCALAYRVARRAGYSENLSKSLAVAVATNYAILKNVGFFGSRKEGKTFEEKLIDSPEALEKYDILSFCGCAIVVDPEKELAIGLAYVKGRQTPFYPQKFDQQVAKINRIKPNAFKYLCKQIDKELDEWEEDFAHAPFGKRYFQFWKSIRDRFREPEFYKIASPELSYAY